MKRYNHHQRDPETAKRYDGRWRKIRAAYIAGRPLCEMCKADGKLVPANVVHHRVPLDRGGGHDWDNLQSLCERCHSKHHAEDGTRWVK